LYDLKQERFRDYIYDDYISKTTGYDWRDPTAEEINLIETLIKQIMPDDEERRLYLQILCSALEGRCLEKFIVFNGRGGNGKGMIDDLLLLALGEYGMIGNNALLFEINRTGGNPEKANMHKKRLVIFREPPERNKFENSIVKELTGGGTYCSRGLYETSTKKELHLTMVVECNKKPQFSEEPTTADKRRIIDVQFRTTYTHDDRTIDEKNHIYPANTYYKEPEFQHAHVFALLYILMNAHKVYKQCGYKWVLPEQVDDATKTYVEESCDVIVWFKDNYTFTGVRTDVCRIVDLYKDFLDSSIYTYLPKNSKKKYTHSYFRVYFENHDYFKKYFVERDANVRRYIHSWRKNINNEEDD